MASLLYCVALVKHTEEIDEFMESDGWSFPLEAALCSTNKQQMRLWLSWT